MKAQPCDPAGLAAFVKAVVLHMERKDAPLEVATDHFGASFQYGDESIGFMDRGGLLLITIYRSHSPPTLIERRECLVCGDVQQEKGEWERGWPKGVHDERRRAIEKALGCKTDNYWNGGGGHEGISIVVARKTPRFLQIAMQRGATSMARDGQRFEEWIRGGEYPHLARTEFPEPPTVRLGDEYLIWSNEHGRWWGPNETGYVVRILEAGTYTKARTAEIVRCAGYGRADGDPPPEIMIPKADAFATLRY